MFPFRFRLISLFLSFILVFLCSCTCFDSISADERNLEKDIELVAISTQQWTGLAISTNNRLFVSYPNRLADHTISVAELTDNNKVARSFPDEEWNSWQEGKDPSNHLVAVQSVRVDSNNFLWILDSGNPYRDGSFKGVLSGGAKLLKVDLTSDKVVQQIALPAPAVKQNSYLNDFCINEQRNVAYITDSNAGALIIVNLSTGESRRILESYLATRSEGKVLTVAGQPLRNLHSELPRISIDGLALNNDHSRLYWRPLTGENLYSLDIQSLHDNTLGEEQLASRIIVQGPFPPSDGMIFGFYNELFLASIEENAIRAYDGGNETRLVKKRDDFKWPDSFALSRDGWLYFTVSQTHLAQPAEPYKIFKFRVKF